jgi:hypothetical protein
LALESRWQTITLSQSRRQIAVMSAVPVVEIAIMVGIMMVVPIAATVLFVAVGVTMTMVSLAIVVVTVVFVVAVTMVLGYRDGCRECQSYQRDGSSSKEILQRHCGLL